MFDDALTEPTTAAADREAREDWWRERPDAYDPGDQEPNEPRAFCSRCEYGHDGHVCRRCIAEGKA